jgi:uncharacterized protein (TIGR01777 family)
VFRWHTRPGALERLTPPWSVVQVVERSGGIETGSRVVLRMSVGPVRLRWVAEHRGYVEGREFRDVQAEGPFASWEHTHRFEPDGESACYVEDHIEYALPLGPLGSLLGDSSVRAALEATVAYRHRILAGDLPLHRRYSQRPLHVAVTGSSGLIGSSLLPFLTTGGHHVTRLVRGAGQNGTGTARWDPQTGQIDAARLGAVDAVVHLASESIASGRWTDARKAKIRDSRVQPTLKLCESLARLPKKPEVLICASAIGYYGDRGAETLDEDSAPGAGFLAEVCQAWEAATAPARKAGIRVVSLRIGVVLSAAGGALASMLPPFRVGAGGVLGSGKQYMSWIAIDDLLGAMLHVLHGDTLRGPVNAVAPEAVTNREFTKTLGRVLSRPTVVPLPAAAARLAFGEMADETLLASTRVSPTRLAASGYQFHHAHLEEALRHTLGKLR